MIKVKDRFNQSKDNRYGVEANDIVIELGNNPEALENLVDEIVENEDLVTKIAAAIDALSAE